ncbi:unnamed protein product, partial [Prorocentrum cordatum]
VNDVQVRREVPLASHHFLKVARLHVAVDKVSKDRRPPELDVQQLNEESTQLIFRQHSSSSPEDIDEQDNEQHNVNIAWRGLVDAFEHAAFQTLPEKPIAAR